MAMSGQYTVRVHGVLDDNIQRQLDAMSAKIKPGKTGGFYGSLNKDAKGAVKSTKRLGDTVDYTNKKVKQTKSLAGFTPLGASAERATKQTQKLGMGLVTVGKKVLAFGAVTSIIQGVTAGIGDMVQNVFELDAALTEYKKVSDLTGKELDKFTDKAFKAGRSVARTGTEMIQSAGMARKSGFNDEDALKIAKVAEKFRNVADTSLTAEESMGFLISQMKAFKISAKEAESIIDKVNKVGNEFSVGTGDLQLALSKTSSAMSTYGNDINETIGIITAGTEVMVGQPSKVAKGWRTIGANILKLAKSTDVWEAAGGKVNVALKDQDGNLRSTYKILKDLYPQWNELNKEQKSNLALDIAGKHGSCSYRFNCWESLKILIPNYNSNILVA